MAYSRRLRTLSRKVTVSRQRNARRRMVRMSRAGYGSSSLTRYARVLSSSSAHPEIKTLDQASGAITLNLNSTLNIQALNLIQTGSSFFNRIGRKIEMVSLYITGSIIGLRTAANSDYVRILVLYDRQTNGALPTATTVLSSYDQAGGTTTSNLVGMNPDERERFAVIMDERIFLPITATAPPSATGVDGVNTSFNIKRFFKLRNLLTHYKADSNPAVIGDIATGGLYICGIGAFAPGSEGYQAQLACRLRYKDT